MARGGYTEIAELLIAKGTNVDALDNIGHTSLHVAALSTPP